MAAVTEHPPGTIIGAGGEFLRCGGFVNSMLDVHRPVGTACFIKQSVSIVENLNDCIRQMRGDWIWIQGDDGIFDNGTLMALLDHQVDVVVPLMVKRAPPVSTVIYKDFNEGEGYMPFDFDELPEDGLLEVFAAGSHGMLIRKHVLEAVGWPKSEPWEKRLWFEYEQGQRLNEDLVLCRRIREAGYKIWCDVETTIGHRGMFTAWPVYENGRWGLGLNMGPSTNGKSNTLVVQRELQEVRQ